MRGANAVEKSRDRRSELAPPVGVGHIRSNMCFVAQPRKHPIAESQLPPPQETSCATDASAQQADREGFELNCKKHAKQTNNFSK